MLRWGDKVREVNGERGRGEGEGRNMEEGGREAYGRQHSALTLINGTLLTYCTLSMKILPGLPQIWSHTVNDMLCNSFLSYYSPCSSCLENDAIIQSI